MNGTQGGRSPLYVRPMPRTWWLQTSRYRRFASRELTSVAVAASSVILLALLFALSRGRDAYEGFLGWLDSSGAVVLSAIILAGVLYHTITWLRLTAHIQVVRLGRRVLPRRLVLAGLLTLWVAMSAIVAYLHIWL